MRAPVVGASGPQFAVAESSQEADDLDGFTQTHLVSQDTSCLLTMELPQPPHASLLVPDNTIHACANHNLKQAAQLF